MLSTFFTSRSHLLPPHCHHIWREWYPASDSAKGVAAPIVGATNPAHFMDATKAVDLVLSDKDVAFLEEPYRAHEVVGALTKSQSLKDVMPKK